MEPVTRGESARRSLFGPVDHEQLRRELKLRLQELAEQDSRRWNFDFARNAPLAGGFQWEEVPAQRAAPLHAPTAQLRDAERGPDGADREKLGGGGSGGGGGGGGAGPGQENRSIVSNTPKFPAEVTTVRRKRTRCKPAKLRSNRRITDFFPKRRRTETQSVLTPRNSSSETCRSIR